MRRRPTLPAGTDSEAPMLIYDDTATAAISAAAEKAGQLGAARYGTEHVLLGLVRSAAPVTRLVVAADPQLVAASVRAPVLDERAASAEGGSPTPGPGSEFRAGHG